jgi:flagellar biosynthesis protein FlhA
MHLVMDPAGGKPDIPGEQTREPTFGLPAVWISEANREEATFKGYTIVEPSTVMITHLTEIIKDHMAELLSYTETQKLLDQLGEEYKKLVSDVVPEQISVSGLQRVLQSLLQERVSIRDLPLILEGVSEMTGQSRNLTLITEHVRMRLCRYISESNANDQGVILIVSLSPEWEQEFTGALVGTGDDKQLALAPSKLQAFVTKIRGTFERHASIGEFPVLLTNPAIRPHVRAIIERFRPATVVLSQNEIHPKAKIKTVGQV